MEKRGDWDLECLLEEEIPAKDAEEACPVWEKKRMECDIMEFR